VFKRVSLSGSAELFRETQSAPEILAETEPEPMPPAAIHHLPLPRDGRDPRDALPRELPGERNGVAYYEYQLTEAQVRALIDAVQKLKYPHTVKSAAKLSMEEFESMEALRQILLEGLR
jgi:hypothetical protein